MDIGDMKAIYGLPALPPRGFDFVPCEFYRARMIVESSIQSGDWSRVSCVIKVSADPFTTSR